MTHGDDYKDQADEISAKKNIFWVIASAIAAIIVGTVALGGLAGLIIAVIAIFIFIKLRRKYDPGHWNYKKPPDALLNEARKEPLRGSGPYSGEQPQTEPQKNPAWQEKIKSEPLEKPKKLAIIGALIGLFLGSSLGVAGFGTAVNGWLIFSVIGGVIGYLVGNQKPRE